jgi:hypothetical protein
MFQFMIIMLKNLILKVDLSRFFLNASTCKDFQSYKMGYK